ncbi:MAG TPA: hypothetical protein VHV28_11665 [Solirubrobacteraceae bacterium]|nr:hypothetical protein [Solirubrobacteraceae bacterium]
MKWLGRSIVVQGALVLMALALVAAATATAGGERANRRAAQRDAARLLAHPILPSNAIPSAGEPADDQHFLSRPGQVPAAVNLVDLHRWWTVPEDEALVSAFVNAHQPKGTRGVTGGVGDGVDFTTESLTFKLPSVGRSLGTRWLVVAMVTLPGDQTGVRIDAEVQWLIPRPAGERVPSAARLLEVTVARPGRPPAGDVTVTRAGEVRRMASLIDGLQTEQPGAFDCTGRAVDPVATFTFRAEPAPPARRVLARATQIIEPSPRGGYCEPMTFTVKGRPQTPLVGGAGVVRAAQRLLGVRVPRG